MEQKETKLKVRAKEQMTTEDGTQRMPGDEFELGEREALGYVGDGCCEQIPDDPGGKKQETQDYKTEQHRAPEQTASAKKHPEGGKK